VDLGYAPGSWSQVAIDKTKPKGRVLGVDIIPAQPPRGVSTIQGNFLSPEVQADVREFFLVPNQGRPNRLECSISDKEEGEITVVEFETTEKGQDDVKRTADLSAMDERAAIKPLRQPRLAPGTGQGSLEGRVVDVVLSDMSAPWDQTRGLWKRSLSDPYIRMMNTSGMSFRDHAGSMDLCRAALQFSHDTLHTGGHLVCKFFQGSEDKALETQMKRLFHKVYREKPESSRSDSKEAYFVGVKRRNGASKAEVLPTY